MNRRVAEYLPIYGDVNYFISIAAFILGTSFLLPLANFVYSWAKGPAAEANPWQAMTLEWQTASPPIKENFDVIPEVVADFYGYGEIPPGEMPYRVPEPGVN
jgi:cytochrome c oxidase subunit 1